MIYQGICIFFFFFSVGIRCVGGLCKEGRRHFPKKLLTLLWSAAQTSCSDVNLGKILLQISFIQRGKKNKTRKNHPPPKKKTLKSILRITVGLVHTVRLCLRIRLPIHTLTTYMYFDLSCVNSLKELRYTFFVH